MREGQQKDMKELLEEVSGSLRGRGGEKDALLSSILGDQKVMEEYITVVIFGVDNRSNGDYDTGNGW